MVWALPKLCQRLFLTGFGPRQAALPLRFPVLRGVGLDCRSAQPHISPTPPQPNPGQVSPAQLTAARPKPWCGPCRTLCKGFSYRIQRSHFRPRDGSVFGAFLARLGPPCRCVWLFWRVHVWCVLGAPKCRPGYAFLVPSPAQHSPAQPSPQPSPSLGVGLAKALPILPNAFSYWIQTYRFPAQPSTAQLVHPSLGVGLAKALPKAFSYRIWPVSGRPAAAFPCFEGVGLDCRSAQPKPLSPAQVSPSPGQPSPGQVSPAQLTAARPKPWCGPCRTLCKGFSYRIQRSHFRPRDGSVFGAFLACLGPPCRCVWPFWRVYVWCVLGAPKCPSRAKHARLWYGPAQPQSGLAESSLAVGLPTPASEVQPTPSPGQPAQSAQGTSANLSPLRRGGSAAWFLVPSPAQHSPAQPKPWCGPCQSSAKGFFLFCATLFSTGFRRTVFQPSPAQPS